ncbi:uncharacterized protein LOC107359937 isoform X2 [Tetranychus urticae]|uniref:Uncharacterized protein n=2 Tax=Tetranychus urticae TaxID=32264 RepID=T1JT78_TETUR|nr:uncharacterized protein LOC107359937 isoform X2 [Tetranychus urticae]
MERCSACRVLLINARRKSGRVRKLNKQSILHFLRTIYPNVQISLGNDICNKCYMQGYNSGTSRSKSSVETESDNIAPDTEMNADEKLITQYPHLQQLNAIVSPVLEELVIADSSSEDDCDNHGANEQYKSSNANSESVSCDESSTISSLLPSKQSSPRRSKEIPISEPSGSSSCGSSAGECLSGPSGYYQQCTLSVSFSASGTSDNFRGTVDQDSSSSSPDDAYIYPSAADGTDYKPDSDMSDDEEPAEVGNPKNNPLVTRRSKSGHSTCCFGCAEPNTLKSVPIKYRVFVLIKINIFVPEGTRCCVSHLLGEMTDWLALPPSNTEMSLDDFQKAVNLLRNVCKVNYKYNHQTTNLNNWTFYQI